MNLDERVKKIEERNLRVELDKAWEISWFRRILVGLLTFIIVGLFLSGIEVKDPWVNAWVPVLGFLLSSLTVSFAKKLWLKSKNERG